MSVLTHPLRPFCPALGCHHLDLHLYQPQETIPAPGFHSGCPSKGAGRLLKDTNPKGCGAANSRLTRHLCVCWFQALTKGSQSAAPYTALSCADQAQQKATAPLLKEKASSMESQPKPKHAGWRQSQASWGGWDVQTSVPHLTAVEIEQKNNNEASSNWKSGQEMSGRNP